MLFIIAVILTIVFVTKNMGGFKMASERSATIPSMQKIQKNKDCEKGATIPEMQPVKPNESSTTSEIKPVKPTESSKE